MNTQTTGSKVKGARKGKGKGSPAVETQSPVTDAVEAVALSVEAPAVEAVEVEAPAAPAVEAVPYSATLLAGIVARMGEQSSKDLDTAISNARKGARSIDALYAMPAWSGVLDTLACSVKVADKRSPSFIAVKALVKIVGACVGIASGVRGEFDPYSRTILANLVTLAGISNKSALVALSRSVVYDELEAQQALTRHYNCSASTASTQASSTRMMLMHLGICAVVKGKRADMTSTSDDARCVQTLAMFAS